MPGLDDVTRICGYGGKVYAHLKLVKFGGIAPTMRAARSFRSNVPFMIGQMNEGAAATAATLHVACATSPAFAELYGADGLIDDPVSGISYDDGTVRANDAPGLGVTFDPAKTISSETTDMDSAGVLQGGELAFPKAEYEQRVARARRLLEAAGIDAMIVTGPENIFYLTGQQTPGYYTFQALVLPVDGEPAFVVRQLEYFNLIANTFISSAQVYRTAISR